MHPDPVTSRPPSLAAPSEQTKSISAAGTVLPAPSPAVHLQPLLPLSAPDVSPLPQSHHWMLSPTPRAPQGACLAASLPKALPRASWPLPPHTGLEETQAGIKIAKRNINNLRYADDTTLMAESEEELKSLLKKLKEESEKVGLKLNIQKTKIMASGPITSWEIDGETVSDFIFGGLQNHCRW